eukprot:8492934-Pyramimonas_sp.AAC.1
MQFAMRGIRFDGFPIVPLCHCHCERNRDADEMNAMQNNGWGAMRYALMQGKGSKHHNGQRPPWKPLPFT